MNNETKIEDVDIISEEQKGLIRLDSKEAEVITFLPEKRSDVLHLDSRIIQVIDGFNIREDYGNLEELAASIKENGLRNPLRGFKENGIYYLTDGHRRLKAIQLLNAMGHTMRVPFLTEKSPSPEKRVLDMYICNDGKRLTPLEESTLFARLENFGMTVKEISDKLGCTETHVYNMRILADIPTRLKNRVRNNEISATLVMNIVRGNKTLSIETLTASVEAALDKAKVNGKKVTKTKLDAELKQTNSLSDLRKVMNEVNENTVSNTDLYNFAMGLIKNKYTAEDIKNLFGVKLAEETLA